MAVAMCMKTLLFQHTAARRRLGNLCHCVNRNLTVSTHSRPKAAGMIIKNNQALKIVSTHSRPKAAGYLNVDVFTTLGFQHTAARRRLAKTRHV
mgnify:CR=1 FL=1